MADPRWRRAPSPTFIINDIIVTSLLALDILLAKFMILSYTLVFRCFSLYTIIVKKG